jgi:hypothetical protein
MRSRKDLLSLLQEAQTMESAFESVTEWEGFLTIGDNAVGQLLRRLMSESNAHERIVESMIRMVRTTEDVPAPSGDTSQVDFHAQDETALLLRLQEFELMMHDMYNDIRTALGKSDINSLVDARNAPIILKDLDTLVAAEAMHYKLVTDCIAKR